MEYLPQVAFVLVAAGLFVRGYLNVTWTLSKEHDRFRHLVEFGLARSMTRNAIVIVLFGGLLAFAARSLAYAQAWQYLGAAIVLLGSTSFLVATFGKLDLPSDSQLSEDAVLLKRVLHRRISGVLFLLGGIA